MRIAAPSGKPSRSGRAALKAGLSGMRTRRYSPRAFPDGVCLVELAGLTESALVEHAVAQALRVPEEDGAELPVLLARFLRDRRMLLLLDKCEHLVPACAALTHRLLRTAGALRVLTTSRQVLEVAGEQVFRCRRSLGGGPLRAARRRSRRASR